MKPTQALHEVGQGLSPDSAHRFQGAIFDVDGVFVDSPHYRAWRDALQELMDTEWAELRRRTSYAPEKFTEAVYQQVVAGRPRLAGARAALEYFGVPDAGSRAGVYAAVKQEHLVTLIEAGEFTAFADAIRFVLATKAAGIPVAAASSSKNADPLLRQVRLGTYIAGPDPDLTLLDLLDADVSGRDLPRGKPDPMIFVVAAEELVAPPERCFVVEDAAAGVRAAKAAGWPPWVWPASTTRNCWPVRARTWWCGRSTRYLARPWPKAGSSAKKNGR